MAAEKGTGGSDSLVRMDDHWIHWLGPISITQMYNDDIGNMNFTVIDFVNQKIALLFLILLTNSCLFDSDKLICFLFARIQKFTAQLAKITRMKSGMTIVIIFFILYSAASSTSVHESISKCTIIIHVISIEIKCNTNGRTAG